MRKIWRVRYLKGKSGKKKGRKGGYVRGRVEYRIRRRKGGIKSKREGKVTVSSMQDGVRL